MKQDSPSRNRYKAHRSWKRLRKAQDAEGVRQYAEQEIQSLSRNQTNSAGVIRPDTGDLHMPSDLAEAGYAEQAREPARVMLVIITLSLIFIAIITYFVAQMPPKN